MHVTIYRHAITQPRSATESLYLNYEHERSFVIVRDRSKTNNAFVRDRFLRSRTITNVRDRLRNDHYKPLIAQAYKTAPHNRPYKIQNHTWKSRMGRRSRKMLNLIF